MLTPRCGDQQKQAWSGKKDPRPSICESADRRLETDYKTDSGEDLVIS